MLVRRRRLRWVSALLAVLSPPAAGTWLPVLHPCPVDAPWLAERSAGPGARDRAEHAGHERAGEPAGHRTCHCIGLCEAGVGAAALAAAAPNLSLRHAPQRSPGLTESATPAAPRPWYSQPPATAPPLV
jgi:hypothetical protein